MTADLDLDELDLLSVGAWAIFDHLAQLEAYPREGQTVRITSPLEALETARFGDCSINVAAVAAALGLRSGLATVVGDDFAASGYQAHLQALRVDLGAVEVRAGERSGHNYLYFDERGDGFCLSHLGVAADQTEWRVPRAALEGARAVVVSEMFGPYTLDALQRARARGAHTAINGMVATAGEATADFLACADWLFISASELRDLLERLGLQHPRELLDLGPTRLFVTGGREGSETWSESGYERVPAVTADSVVDATGAGDAYAAGTLAGLLRGLSPSDAARVGAATASIVVEAWGAQGALPSWDAMQARRTRTAPPPATTGGDACT